MSQPKNAVVCPDSRYFPAVRSFCVAHAVYKGGTKFDLNPQRPGGLREIDRWGIPYVIVNVRGSRDVAKRVLREGLTVPFQVCSGCGREVAAGVRTTCKKCGALLPKKGLKERRFVVTDGYVRAGDGSTMVLFEAGGDDPDVPSTPAEFRDKLGVASELKSDSDMLKFQKYFKRFLAPVRTSVAGTVVKWLDNGFVAELWKRDEASGGLVRRLTYVHTPVIEGTTLNVDGVEYPAELFYDGALRISVGFASWLMNEERANRGLGPMEDGEGLQLTVVEPKKLYKGLAECVKRQRWDLVCYLGKKQLHSQFDMVTVQVMQELHASGQEYTDVQSAVALDQSEQLEAWAIESMKQFRGVLSDSRRVGGDLDRIIKAMTPEDLNDVEDPVWSLIQAHEARLPITDLPWARRRLIGFFRKAMLNMAKFRVPLPEWAIGVYGAVDRTAFNEDGLIDPEKALLKDGQCSIPFRDGVGECALIRRPIANKNEQSFFMRVMLPGYVTPKCPYVYLPLATIPSLVKKHGGFDWDDRFQACLDPVEIARRREVLRAPQYPVHAEEPVQEKPAIEKKADALLARLQASNPFQQESELLAKRVEARDPMDPLRRVMNALMGRKGGMTIEGASNRIIVDNANLNNGVIAVPTLSQSSANLEDIIDSNVHVAGGDVSHKVILAELAEFDKNVELCEEVLMGRLPRKSFVDGELIEVRSRVEPYQGKLTVARRTIEVRQKQFMELLENETKTRIRSAFPSALESVKETREALAVLSAMAAFWSIRMEDDRVNGKSVPVAPDNNKRKLRAELTEVYRQRGWDLEERDVRARFEDELGIEAFKLTQKELWLEFDSKPHTLQAVAIGLKRAYCEVRGGDGKFSGNHTVRWYIAVWSQLCGFTPPAGQEVVDVLGTVQVRRPEVAAPAAKQSVAPDAVVAAPSKEGVVVTVVAGLYARHSSTDTPEVQWFQSKAGHDVELVQCLYLSEKDGVYEDAVLVMDGPCDGKLLKDALTVDEVLASYYSHAQYSPDNAYVGFVSRAGIAKLDFSAGRVLNAHLKSNAPFTLKAVVLES